jgi:predicted lipoprotein with Yx(FWY)xxD motif
MNARFTQLAAAMTLASMAAGCATTSVAEPKLLTTNTGMTAYTFDKDGTGKSNCNGPCATTWPPIKPGEMSGADFSTIVRDDGSQQAAFKGKPIYLFAADQKPGDMNGDNVQQVWHVVTLAGKAKIARPVSDAYGSYGGYSYGY